AITPFALAPLWLPACAAPGLDVATLVILLGLPIGGAIAGWKVAAQYLAKPMKGVLAAAGLVHALAPGLSCLLFARLFSADGYTPAGGAFAIVIASAGLHLARPLYKSEGKLYTWLLALLPLAVFAVAMGPLLWLAHGACVKGTPEHWFTDVVRFVVAGA